MCTHKIFVLYVIKREYLIKKVRLLYNLIRSLKNEKQATSEKSD